MSCYIQNKRKILQQGDRRPFQPAIVADKVLSVCLTETSQACSLRSPLSHVTSGVLMVRRRFETSTSCGFICSIRGRCADYCVRTTGSAASARRLLHRHRAWTSFYHVGITPASSPVYLNVN